MALPRTFTIQQLSLLARGRNCRPEQILAEQMVMRWKSQHLPKLFFHWLSQVTSGMLLTLPGASVKWAGWFFPAFSLDGWEDLKSLEKVSLCELRKTPKKKKLSEVENKRFNFVGKRGKQYGGWFGSLDRLTTSGTVDGSKGTVRKHSWHFAQTWPRAWMSTEATSRAADSVPSPAAEGG